MATVRYSFTMDALKDAHLVRWLERQPNLSAAVRDALRSHVERPSPAALDAKLDRVLDALRGGVRLVQPGEPETQSVGGEPEKAKAGLEAMIKRFGGR